MVEDNQPDARFVIAHGTLLWQPISGTNLEKCHIPPTLAFHNWSETTSLQRRIDMK